MAAYKIYFRKSVLKDLEKIQKQDLKRIISRIEALADDPRPPGVEKISGLDRYRIRQGDYRIIYSIQDKELTIWIVKIGHRRDIYRKLEKNRPFRKIHESLKETSHLLKSPRNARRLLESIKELEEGRGTEAD
jgi:mRNA interferase RelE/StbE